MRDRAPEATGRRICFRLCPRPESTEVGDEAFEYALTAGDIVLPAFAGTASGKEGER